MDLITISGSNTSPFEQIKQVDDSGSEYWLATDLLASMGYQSWKRIKDTVERAKISALNSGLNVSYHFTDVVQMAQIGGSQAFRETLKDYRLSRYACYITAMNGDPRKPEIADAQSYFAYKTSQAELAPQNQEILSQVLEQLEQQNRAIEKQGEEIAQLQLRIQNLIPPSANFIPPGWDAEVWDKLPPQDKRHFRFLFRCRHFQPSNQTNAESVVAITEQAKQKQKQELDAVVGEIPQSEKERLEIAKQQALKQLQIDSK
jgi:DNA-damage-inducible protein D